MQCLYPDCDVVVAADPSEAKLTESQLLERSKRAMINHINSDHDDAHVLIPCAHDFQHVEYFDATTRDGTTGAEITFPQERRQCVRCDQFEVRDREVDADA